MDKGMRKNNTHPETAIWACAKWNRVKFDTYFNCFLLAQEPIENSQRVWMSPNPMTTFFLLHGNPPVSFAMSPCPRILVPQHHHSPSGHNGGEQWSWAWPHRAPSARPCLLPSLWSKGNILGPNSLALPGFLPPSLELAETRMCAAATSSIPDFV